MPAFRISLLLLLHLTTVGSTVAAASAAQEAGVLQAMRQGGVVVLIRHSATEPGIGDPPGFKLADCTGQRNLSDAGRAQARRLGQWFTSHRLVPTSVRASPWCRTRETATLAFGRSEDWWPLSNLIPDRSRQDDQARQVRSVIAGASGDDLIVFISHGVSINAFIGVYLDQGELVVVRPTAGADGDAGREVVGRMLVP